MRLDPIGNKKFEDQPSNKLGDFQSGVPSGTSFISICFVFAQKIQVKVSRFDETVWIWTVKSTLLLYLTGRGLHHILGDNCMSSD